MAVTSKEPYSNVEIYEKLTSMIYWEREIDVINFLSACSTSRWLNEQQKDYLMKSESTLHKWSKEAKRKTQSYDILTTSRCESMNNSIKQSIYSNISLIEFLVRMIQIDVRPAVKTSATSLKMLEQNPRSIDHERLFFIHNFAIIIVSLDALKLQFTSNRQPT